MIFSSTKSCTKVVALVGGGANPMPSEISLAHNGELLLDEFPEFPKVNIWEVLRKRIRQCTCMPNLVGHYGKSGNNHDKMNFILAILPRVKSYSKRI